MFLTYLNDVHPFLKPRGLRLSKLKLLVPEETGQWYSMLCGMLKCNPMAISLILPLIFRCDVGFSGVRCVHSELVRQPLSTEYVALTVILILLFLIAISIASYYICRR